MNLQKEKQPYNRSGDNDNQSIFSSRKNSTSPSCFTHFSKTHITYFLLKQTSWITYKKTKFDLFQNVIHFHPINIHCSKIYLILKYKFPNNDFVIDIVRCPF